MSGKKHSVSMSKRPGSMETCLKCLPSRRMRKKFSFEGSAESRTSQARIWMFWEWHCECDCD